MIEWHEELPDQCPPEEAFNPNGMTVYRFCSTETPSESDFISQRMLFPGKVFNGITECTAKSLSVINDLEACKNKLKLPRIKKRFNSILEVNLTNGDGLILKTFNDPNHFSWWRSKSFSINSVKRIK